MTMDNLLHQLWHAVDEDDFTAFVEAERNIRLEYTYPKYVPEGVTLALKAAREELCTGVFTLKLRGTDKVPREDAAAVRQEAA